jgi:hypothetical protein
LWRLGGKYSYRLFGQPLKGIQGPFEKGQMVETLWEAYRVVEKFGKCLKKRGKCFGAFYVMFLNVAGHMELKNHEKKLPANMRLLGLLPSMSLQLSCIFGKTLL